MSALQSLLGNVKFRSLSNGTVHTRTHLDSSTKSKKGGLQTCINGETSCRSVRRKWNDRVREVTGCDFGKEWGSGWDRKPLRSGQGETLRENSDQ